MTGKSRCKPNFFIVGAPKSGTTSLHNYLASHPDVFMSSQKEPCFLAPDFNSPAYPQDEQEYLKLFDGQSGQRRIGESTTSYLYSKLAAQAIHDYNPKAKIIAMLRNPVDMVASLHAQYVKSGIEDIYSFQDALSAESTRSSGVQLPDNLVYPPEYLIYRQVGKYFAQISRFYNAFGEDNLHVMIFDDFSLDPQKELNGVCDFLDIDIPACVKIKAHNTATTPRSRLLHKITSNARPWERRIVNLARPIFPKKLGRLLWHEYRSVLDMNLKKGRPAVDRKLRSELISFYQNDIHKLECLLDRSLEQWCC